MLLQFYLVTEQSGLFLPRMPWTPEMNINPRAHWDDNALQSN